MKQHEIQQIENAIRVATEAHAGQVYAKTEPYILHPLRVMARFNDRPYYPEKAKHMMIAVLHDVIEDTPVTAGELLYAGIPAGVVDAVVEMSRYPDEPYLEYVARVAKHPDARVVKLADLKENLSYSTGEKGDSPRASLVPRYERAVAMVQAAMASA